MTGALLGLLLAGGVLQVTRRLPVRRRPTLDDRVAPYLGQVSIASAWGTAGRERLTPFPAVERLAGPVLRLIGARLGGLLGGSRALSQRLVAAGLPVEAEQFRAEQVLWACLGGSAILALLALRAATGWGPTPATDLVLMPTATLTGALARDWWLGRQVDARSAALVAELPVVAELLALAVAAGEGPVGALERVSRACGGVLGAELGAALADTRAGTQLVTALQSMASRSSVASLQHFVSGLAIALERGTPLADVLRAQAMDVREEGKRALLASAGRKEIQMLVPVVFLVLPVTVVFALYPGLVSIDLLVR